MREQRCQVLIAHVSTAAALVDTSVAVEFTLTQSAVVFQENTPLRPHYGAVSTYLPVRRAHSLSFFHGAGPGRVPEAAVTEGILVSAAAEKSWERGGVKEGGEGREGREGGEGGRVRGGRKGGCGEGGCGEGEEEEVEEAG